MGGEAGRSLHCREVASVAIVLERVVEELREPLLRAVLAGRPGGANSARPVGRGGQQAPRGERTTLAPPDALSGVHVLIVDDQEDAREILQLLLEDYGATVTA